MAHTLFTSYPVLVDPAATMRELHQQIAALCFAPPHKFDIYRVAPPYDEEQMKYWNPRPEDMYLSDPATMKQPVAMFGLTDGDRIAIYRNPANRPV